jgi:hypothetical protein
VLERHPDREFLEIKSAHASPRSMCPEQS